MSDLEVLERPVSAVEQEAEGEKCATLHILGQTRRNSDDLATIKSRLAAHDRRFDSHDARFDRLESEMRGVRSDPNGLRRDLPGIVGDTLREVLKERDR